MLEQEKKEFIGILKQKLWEEKPNAKREMPKEERKSDESDEEDFAEQQGETDQASSAKITPKITIKRS